MNELQATVRPLTGGDFEAEVRQGSVQLMLVRGQWSVVAAALAAYFEGLT